jgi:hypothetical protein
MDRTALDGDVTRQACPDRFGEGLRAVDDEKARHNRIEAAFEEIVVQRLNGCGVSRGPLDYTQWMIVDIPVGADMLASGLPLFSVAGIALVVIGLRMPLLFFEESTPRA